MPIQIQRLPPELETLQKEIRQHYDLWKELKEISDFTEYIAHVCTYCDVLVDGYYMPNDMKNLCLILTDKLYTKRTGLVIV